MKLRQKRIYITLGIIDIQYRYSCGCSLGEQVVYSFGRYTGESAQDVCSKWELSGSLYLMCIIFCSISGLSLGLCALPCGFAVLYYQNQIIANHFIYHLNFPL